MTERLKQGYSFESWAAVAEPRLRHAFTALFGVTAGTEAATDAISFAWERWDRLSEMENPTGYVYISLRRKVWRDSKRSEPMFVPVPDQSLPWVEPDLPAALESLSDRQRQAVILIHGYGWTYAEVAEVLGVTKSTIQNHLERGLASLRLRLGVHDGR